MPKDLARLFTEASERPSAEWPTFVADAEAIEPQLGEKLAAMLEAHAATTFIEHPASPLGPSASSETRAAGHLGSGARLGPYEIVALIGAGAMGEVYRARDDRLGRDVAIKVLPAALTADPTRHRRMEQEARAAGMLNHPNILTVYDIGISGGAPFIVSELLEGSTLRGVIEETRRHGKTGLPVEEACRFVLAIAQGLAAAHARGIVHRDLKPENVFVTRDGRVKILDFGIAKLSHDTAGADLQTQTGAVLGTVGYMAPEQLRGQKARPASDIFAAGTICYELISGRRPFEHDSVAEILSAILTKDPVPLGTLTPTVPPFVVAIVERCLQKEAAARFQSGAELSHALSTETIATSTATAALPRSPRQRRLVAITAAAVVLGGIVTGTMLWQAENSDAPSDEPVPSLVVLPTRVFGGPDAAFLEEAIPANLSAYLAQYDGLVMKLPPTTDEVTRVGGDVGRIAQAYAATSCVLTTLTVHDERLSLGVQLVDPSTRQVRWSREYTGTRDTYLAMLQEAAREMQLELLPSAAQEIVASGPLSSDAELALQAGDFHARRYAVTGDPASFAAARNAYERALALDPARAETPAGLASLYGRQWQSGQTTQEAALQEVRRWAQRAIALDQRSGEAWAAVVSAETLEPRPDPLRVVDHALKAAGYAPRCVYCLAALSEALVGSAYTLSLATTGQLHQLEPLNVLVAGNYAFSLVMVGRGDEALPVITASRSLEQADPWLLLQEALVLADTGGISQALERLGPLADAVRDQRLIESALVAVRAAVTLAAGDREGAAADLRRVYQLVDNPTGAHWDRLLQQMVVAPFLLEAGLREEAMRLLELGATHDVAVPYDWLTGDPRLSGLRSHPRFEPLARRTRPRFDSVIALLTQASERGELPAFLAVPLREAQRLGSR